MFPSEKSTMLIRAPGVALLVTIALMSILVGLPLGDGPESVASALSSGLPPGAGETGARWAHDCSLATQIPEAECEALVALYGATHGDNWPQESGWLQTDTPCQWRGVTCSAGHVTQIDLSSYQLRGIIAPELGNLANLEYLDLSSNMLSGSIPPELARLTHLKVLDLSFNQLAGSIPAELGNLANLTSLGIEHNGFLGAISASLSGLVKKGEATPTPLPPPGLEYPAMETAIRPKVLVLSYNPWLATVGVSLFRYESGYDPMVTSEQLRLDFLEASGGFVDVQILGHIERNEFPMMTNGLRMTESEYLQFRAQGLSYGHVYTGAMINMSYAIEDGALNLAVKNREIDEIWMFGSWQMSAYESRMGGPGAFWINGPTFTTDSGRAFVVMGFENAVGVPNSLHSVGHRVECTLDRAYGHISVAPDTPWARFRKHANMPATWLPGVPFGVGDTENPPNSTGAYDYRNRTYVDSTANDWLNFPNLTGATQPVNCFTWGDSDYGYYQWWYGHLPKADGVSPRAYSAPDELRQNNWWKYIFQFNDYLELIPEPTPTPTPTGTPRPTPTPTSTPHCAGCAIGTWHETSALPRPIGVPGWGAGQQIIATNGRLYVFGGRDSADQRLPNVYSSATRPDGTLSEWNEMTPLPGLYYYHAEIQVGDCVYMITGAAGSTDVYYAVLGADGTLGPWTRTASLNPSRQDFAVAASGSYIYATGGNSGGLRDFVHFAKVQPGGALMPWSSTTSLPEAMQGHTMMSYGHYLYILAPSGSAYYAPVHADGTLGSWTATTSMPRELSEYSSFAYNGTAYLLGGRSRAGYYAPIQGDGSLGQWQQTESLPEQRSGFWAGAANCYAYAVGGENSGVYRDTAYFAPLQEPPTPTATYTSTATNSPTSTSTPTATSTLTPIPTPTQLPTLPGDLDGDCDVDIVDIMLVASRWNTVEGNAKYEARYDTDHDGDIDIVDIMLVASHWEESCPTTPTPTATLTGTPPATPTPGPTPTTTIYPSPFVRIDPSCCQFDAPGDDNQNLNEEWVCFTNTCCGPAYIGGWQVKDQANHTYTFVGVTLVEGATVKLHSGCGTNTATDVYWCSGSAIWNNDHDKVYLYSAGGGHLMDLYAY